MTPAVDQEIQLRALASVAERRNRPTALVALAVALLVVALGFAAWSASVTGQARAELRAAARQRAEAAQLASDIQAFRLASSTRFPREKYQPELQLLGRIDQVYQKLGMASRPNLFEQGPRQLGLDSPLQAKRIRATINDTTLADAMRWINTVIQDIRGVHVTSVEFRPQTGRGWAVDVELARWELKQ